MASGQLFERVSEAAGRAVGQAQVIADRVVPEEERGVIRRVMDLPVQKQLQLARRLWDDPRMPAAARASVLVGLGYAILPIKLSPRFLGPLRDFEKIVGLGVLLWALLQLAPRDVIDEHLDELEKPGLWSRITRRGSRDAGTSAATHAAP